MWASGLAGRGSHTCILPEIFEDPFQHDNISFSQAIWVEIKISWLSLLGQEERSGISRWRWNLMIFPITQSCITATQRLSWQNCTSNKMGSYISLMVIAGLQRSVWEGGNSSWIWVLWKRSPTTLWDHLSCTCSAKALLFGCYLRMGEMWKINLKVFPDKGNLSSNIETAGSEPS